jgi:hypothetical protein
VRRILHHLTYANVMVTILAFLVLGGGTALAAYVVSSNSQIGPDTVSGHKPPTGKHANIVAGSVNGGDLANGAVTRSKLNAPAAFVSAGLPNPSPAGQGLPTAADCAQDNRWYTLAPGIYDRVGYFRDTSGMVFVQGMAVRCPTSSDTVFTLRPGYRPTEPHQFPVSSDPGNGPVFVRTSGHVDVQAGGINLDGTVFRCGPSGANGCP